MTVADLRRGRQERAAVALATTFDVDDRTVEITGVVDVRGSSGGEVALVRVVRTLGELHACHELGDQEVEIRIALAVRVRREVDGNAGDDRREVTAVIQI